MQTDIKSFSGLKHYEIEAITKKNTELNSYKGLAEFKMSKKDGNVDKFGTMSSKSIDKYSLKANPRIISIKCEDFCSKLTSSSSLSDSEDFNEKDKDDLKNSSLGIPEGTRKERRVSFQF